jgi:hypothetical protein
VNNMLPFAQYYTYYPFFSGVSIGGYDITFGGGGAKWDSLNQMEIVGYYWENKQRGRMGSGRSFVAFLSI